MTPEEKKQFDQMKRDIEDLKQYVSQKKYQQISNPIDEASKEIIKTTFGI